MNIQVSVCQLPILCAGLLWAIPRLLSPRLCCAPLVYYPYCGVSSPHGVIDLWSQGDTLSVLSWVASADASQVVFSTEFLVLPLFGHWHDPCSQNKEHTVFSLNKQFTPYPFTLERKFWLFMHFPRRIHLKYLLLLLGRGGHHYGLSFCSFPFPRD